MTYNEVYSGSELSQDVIKKIEAESHTRLYLAAKNILRQLDAKLEAHECDPQPAIDRLVLFLKYYPADLMIGVMKDVRNNTKVVKKYALENDNFIDAYFKTYEAIRW